MTLCSCTGFMHCDVRKCRVGVPASVILFTAFAKKRRWSVHPINRLVFLHSFFGNCKKSATNFFTYFRMSVTSFHELVKIIRTNVKKDLYLLREVAWVPEAMLAMTPWKEKFMKNEFQCPTPPQLPWCFCHSTNTRLHKTIDLTQCTFERTDVHFGRLVLNTKRRFLANERSWGASVRVWNGTFNPILVRFGFNISEDVGLKTNIKLWPIF